jgi:hypothetical protein
MPLDIAREVIKVLLRETHVEIWLTKYERVYHPLELTRFDCNTKEDLYLITLYEPDGTEDRYRMSKGNFNSVLRSL